MPTLINGIKSEKAACDCDACSTDQYTYPDIGEDDDLFSNLGIGGQGNGLVTGDLGWACFALFERLGIESNIGISGFGSADHYKSWCESVIGVALDDWEAVTVQLYHCWLPCLNEQYPDNNYDKDQFSYLVWREHPDLDAIKEHLKTVFALRHTTYSSHSKPSLDQRRLARTESYNAALLTAIGKRALIATQS